MDSDHADSFVGRKVSHYRIEERLGGGGMGVVYRARDLRLGRVVALKFLLPHLGADHDAKQRFVLEAKAASALDHPNIAVIHEIGETEGGRLFIVMAYYEGETLKQKIARGPLALEEVFEYGSQIAHGLMRAHENGIVHRDVKPANVIVTEDGLAKLVDFGLAKMANVHLTKTGSTVGTVAYMSPEQIRGAAVDHRTDIWSLGVVIYEMVIAHPPFRGVYDQAVFYSILNDEPPSIQELRSGLPAALDRIAKNALAKNPEDRYQHAAELEADLNAVRSGVATSVRWAPGVYGRGSHRMPAPRLVAATVAAVVLSLAFALNVGGLRDVLLGMDSPSRIESLAVLPLSNHINDQEQAYFVDGMTEALIARLARLKALRVISRQSVMSYKGSDKPLPQIAKELNVDAVIEGSVFRGGSRVRITAQLIRAVPEQHLWAESYERDVTDVLTLQNEVAQAIAHEVKVALTPAEASRLATVHSVSPDAYESYLKGRYHWNSRTQEGFEKAIAFFKDAIEKDPSYPLSYVGLADAYGLLGDYGHLPGRDAFPAARRAAFKALEADETVAEAHAALGNIKFAFDWDWAGAEREFRRAIELKPGYATAHHWYALYLTAMGRHTEAARQMNRARELDPLSLIITTNVGWISYYARRYDDAINHYRKALELDPNFGGAVWKLCDAYMQKGMYEEALANSRTFNRLWGLEWSVQLSYLYARFGRRDEALDLLEKIKPEAGQSYIHASEVAGIYAALGDEDEAFVWLEKAFEVRDTWLRFIKVEPKLDPLRDDPRFEALLSRMGLTDSPQQTFPSAAMAQLGK